MNSAPEPAPSDARATRSLSLPRVRDLTVADLPEVVALDAALSGAADLAAWGAVFERFPNREGCLALGAEVTPEVRGEPERSPAPALAGYLFGEQRAFEFGSEACGWVLAVGVREDLARTGIGTTLMDAARERFGAMGLSSVRTMVRRGDVPLLSYFRRQGFVAGPFVQLGLELEQHATTVAHARS